MAFHLDFRYLDEGLGGERGKRKRREEADAAAADSMDLDADAPRPSKLRAMPSLSDPSKPASFGQPTYDGVIAGRVPGLRVGGVLRVRCERVGPTCRRSSLEREGHAEAWRHVEVVLASPV